MTKLEEFEGKKIGFVAGGGVVKAANWHIGVSLALEELGFNFVGQTSPPCGKLDISTYVASSAGALVALYLASGYGPQEIIQAQLGKNSQRLPPITYKSMLSMKNALPRPSKNKAFNPFDSLPPLLSKLISPLTKFSGFFTTSGLKDYLRENVLTSDSFEDYLADIFLVATQLDHSRKVIFSKYLYPEPVHDKSINYYKGISISDAAAASMSVPPIYTPYPINNPYTNKVDYYIDGEIRETLSSHAAIDHGCDLVICSFTHVPYHYQEAIGSLINQGIPAIILQSIYLMIQKKIVAKRNHINTLKETVESINEILIKDKVSNETRKKVLRTLETKFGHKMHVKIIDISPAHHDSRMFFTSNFSLNNDVMGRVIKSGYIRTKRIFESLT